MNKKSKAVVGLSKLPIELKVIKGQSVKDSMQNSGNFPDADMPMSYNALQTIITNTHNSIITASTGNASDVNTMHENEKILVMAFNLIRAHVEIVSNSQSNPDSYILSAGMTVATNSGQNAITDLTLDAMGGGTVQIRVPRTANDKAYYFQYALDSDPNNWQSIGYSSLSKFEFKNQIPSTKLWIRYASIGKTGMGAFSDAKQIIVL